MIYRDMEIHNAAELYETENGISWYRLPMEVCEKLEIDKQNHRARNSTGVELRFVMKSDEVRIRMSSLDLSNVGMTSVFHVFRGGIQGGWQDCEQDKCIQRTGNEVVIKKSENPEILKKMTEQAGYDFDPEVIRVIFDRGHIEIIDVIGDIEPPKKEQLPKRTLLTYGSSITHGSNSIDASHSWASVVAHHLNMDLRNLGMAGSCAMEKEVMDYIAKEGENGKWDIATLELGINVLGWEEDKIYERVRYAVNTVASKNPTKPVIVISPFYCADDFKNEGLANKWRRIIKEIVGELNLANVHYISGLELLGDMSLISADEVHPNIYGVHQIAENLLKFIKRI